MSRWLFLLFAACGAGAEPNAAPSALPRAATAEPSASVAPRTPMTDDEIAAAIHEASPGERTIPEAGRGTVMFTLDKVVDDAFAADAGASKGIRVWAVRPDAILGRLGLENGDTLVAYSSKSALEQSWRGKAFTLKVRRANAILELRYRFVE